MKINGNIRCSQFLNKHSFFFPKKIVVNYQKSKNEIRDFYDYNVLKRRISGSII